MNGPYIKGVLDQEADMNAGKPCQTDRFYNVHTFEKGLSEIVNC